MTAMQQAIPANQIIQGDCIDVLARLHAITPENAEQYYFPESPF